MADFFRLCDPSDGWSRGDPIDLGYASGHAVVRGDTLYVQSEESLRAYDLTRDWAELGETQISHIDHRFSYISGMLATEQR